MKRFEGLLIILAIMFVIILFVSLDVYKWHVFSEATQSDIGYFKWKFFIDSKY